jgi:hypothetical protein
MTLSELGVKFGSVKLVESAQRLLAAYKQRFLATLSTVQRSNADLSSPLVAAAAFLLAAKSARPRVAVDRALLRELAEVTEPELQHEMERMRGFVEGKSVAAATSPAPTPAPAPASPPMPSSPRRLFETPSSPLRRPAPGPEERPAKRARLTLTAAAAQKTRQVLESAPPREARRAAARLRVAGSPLRTSKGEAPKGDEEATASRRAGPARRSVAVAAVAKRTGRRATAPRDGGEEESAEPSSEEEELDRVPHLCGSESEGES